MGFLEDVQAENQPKIGSQCSVAAWLETMSADVVAEFGVAIGDKTIPATVIHKVMREKHGFPAGSTSVQRHRRHECHCS